MQTVFKVVLSDASGRPKEKTFQSRKAHKKSRRGCVYCKQRRIRCDEEQPSCGKCIKNGLACVYPLQQGESPDLQSDEGYSVASPTTDVYSMAVDTAVGDLGEIFGFRLSSGKSTSMGTLRILQHFQNHTASTLGQVQSSAVFHAIVARKAWDHSYLMHMCLAVSAAHLKRLHTSASHATLSEQFSTAEVVHWQKGLQLYRQALDEYSADSSTKPDFDATVAAAFLSVIFTFALEDDLPLDAYTGQDDYTFQQALNPLAATGGFRVVTKLFSASLAESAWMAVILASDDRKGSFSASDQSGIDGLPPAFVDLCELRDDSNSSNNDYYHPVRLLTPLLRLDGKMSNFCKYIAFGGRVWVNIKPLFLRKDPRTLLLVSYWFALLGRLDQWWMTRRARAECMAIVHYLLLLQDPKITPLLPFPATFGQADLGYLWNHST